MVELEHQNTNSPSASLQDKLPLSSGFVIFGQVQVSEALQGPNSEQKAAKINITGAAL